MTKITFYHSGRIGDIIYSLPTIREVRNRTLREEGKIPFVALVLGVSMADFNSIKPLLMTQLYIDDVVQVKNEVLPKGFINLDYFRHNIGAGHIVNMHYTHFFTDSYKYEPWLHATVKKLSVEPYAIINVTGRYRDKFCKWTGEIADYIYTNKPREVKHVFFLGLLDEWRTFRQEYSITSDKRVSYLPTENLKVAAEIIAGAKYFSGTQSSMLAIRQGLGLPYRFEQSPNHADCNWYSPIETVINQRSRKLHFIVSACKKLLVHGK